MMTTTDHIHSRSGLELIRKLANEGERTFTTERVRALAAGVGIANGYLSQALHHLAKGGWIVRLHRGLYAIASTVPGVTPTHEFEIAMALVEPAAISHWSALHHHGLTEQAPRTVFVTTTDSDIPRVRDAVKGQGSTYPVSGTAYQFIRVKPERFFGTEQVWIGESRISITDMERTLIDGITRPNYCGDFAEVLHAFEARGRDINIDRIIDYALKLDAVTTKRLGWILEQQGIDWAQLQRLLDVSITGYRTLDPTGPRKGPCNGTWMIQENLPGRVQA